MAQSRFGGPLKRSLVDVAEGLFLLRFKSSVAPHPPLVTFGSVPGAGRLSILEQPGTIAGMLERPGDVAALAVRGPIQLEIIVEARGPDCTAEAEIDLERVSPDGAAAGATDRAASRAVRHEAATVRGGGEKGGLTLIGHVSRRGDIVATAGEWIAGPSAPAPIEGLEVHAASPLGLEVQVLVSGHDRWSPWIGAGSYAGTRGQARALIGLRFRLSAEVSPRISLDASALFLGSAVNRQTGRSVELVSASGRDPLIGLSLRLSDAAPAPASPEAGLAIVAQPRRERGRVRVFRAGSEVVGSGSLPSA